MRHSTCFKLRCNGYGVGNPTLMSRERRNSPFGESVGLIIHLREVSMVDILLELGTLLFAGVGIAMGISMVLVEYSESDKDNE